MSTKEKMSTNEWENYIKQALADADTKMEAAWEKNMTKQLAEAQNKINARPNPKQSTRIHNLERELASLTIALSSGRSIGP
jgi:polyhydroxyalkanoate synthesis regulator phasin